MHVFADLLDLRWVSRPINDLINLHFQAHPEARLYVHLVYRGVPPSLDKGLGVDWPLIMVPSVIVEWHEQARRDKEPGKDPDVHFDHVHFFNPVASGGVQAFKLKKHGSWRQWLETCVLISGTVTTMNYRCFLATRFPCLDRSWPRWGPRQAVEKSCGEGTDAPNGKAAAPLIQPRHQDQARTAGEGPAQGSAHGGPDPDRPGKRVRAIIANLSKKKAS